MDKERKISVSRFEMSEIMMPEHVNPAQNVHGGVIMKLIDNCAGICALRHARTYVVTASVDRIDFINPSYMGDLVTAKASMNFVGRTSMEVGVRVEAERMMIGKKTHVASAYLTFVALDSDKKPTEIPRLICETEEDRRRFEEGKKRREERLKKIRKK